MKYNKLAASFFFAGMLLLSGCGSSDDPATPPATTTPPVETTPPPVELTPPVATPPPETPTPPASEKPVLDSTTITTTDGEVMRVDRTADGLIFEGHEGKIVLLEIYGDTCPHCKDAIPAYNRLQAKYPNDVYVIALESYGTLNNAHLQQYDTVAKAKTGKMFSFVKELRGYNLEAVPYLMILSRDGDIVYDKILANFPENEIDTLIQQLL